MASAASECTVDVINGTVASSSCYSHVSSSVPSDPSFVLNETLEPTPEADMHKWTPVVDGVLNKDSTHTSIMIGDTQPLNDSS